MLDLKAIRELAINEESDENKWGDVYRISGNDILPFIDEVEKLRAAVRDAKHLIAEDTDCGVCENSSPIGLHAEDWLEKYSELVDEK